MKKLHVFLLLVPLVFFLAGLAYSQSGSTGAIEGKVVDEEGKPLPGVEVKLSSPDLIGGTQVKVTNNEGKFRFVALPRGTYVVEASLPGFVTARRENIRLFVGQTITVDLHLKVATVEEEVMVIGTAPLVDVKDSMINSTNLDKQMLQTVGAEMRFKDPTQLINFAPGVQDRSAMGGTTTSNQWNIDGQGLLTYVGSGYYWNAPDINIMEEIQIAGSGANAEYGGFTGAVMNMITKSGGNTFEGMVEVSHSPLEWNWKNFDMNDPKFSLFEEPPRSRYYDFHFGIGGPIIKDRLWFYVSAGYIQGDFEERPPDLRSEQILKGFAKLTWQPNSNDRMSAWIEYEGWEWHNVGLSPTRPVEACDLSIGPGAPAAINWLHTFSENTFTEIKVGRYWSYWDYRPNSGPDVPQRYDKLTGTYSGNYGWMSDSSSNHTTASATLTHHADEFLRGSHDFKAGVEFFGGFDNASASYPGGYNYVDNYYYFSYYHYYEKGEYYYGYLTFAYSYGYDIKSNGWRVSAFVQD
ncbi:MAG: carboxypeptidase regulatory-like domain-containing protein, partial [Candidatus Zixiibacteriota bacterium]